MSVVIENQARTITEKPGHTRDGGVPAFGVIGLGLLGVVAAVYAALDERWFESAGGVLVVLISAFIGAGLYMLQPNQAAVLTFFGDYRGSDRAPGLRWTNPLNRRRKISLRVRNFNTSTSKVNDANGNPIQVAAVVVWQVIDTGKAAFEVDDYVDYVVIQAEAAVRHMARSYPYDSFDEDGTAPVTLIGEVEEINDSLAIALQERLGAAGVKVLEARLTDLSYAPEIAEAMLRRQQAAAIVAARRKIVEGAVWMVRDAVTQLEQGATAQDAIPLDSDRRATFAANLMTVIASDAPTSPVVNVGTLTR